jgi:transcriptional regulator with PAS, ATPase and Fis domain
MRSAYITFHVYNYGVGFTKNILGAFYSGKLNPEKLDTEYLLQKDLEENSFRLENPLNQHVFDKVYYLYVNQETIDKVTSTRQMKKTDCLSKIKIDDDIKSFYKDWEEIFGANENQNLGRNELKSEIESIRKKGKPELINHYWKLIHYYNFDDQKDWFLNHANSRKVYNQENIEFVNLESNYGLNDLHDHRKIGKAIQSFLKENSFFEKFDDIIINISGIGYEIQVVWFALAQAGWFKEKVHFISTYDRKDQNKRFKDFRITEVSKSVLSEISDDVNIFDLEPVSPERKRAEIELKHFVNKGFSILIQGERGVGKSRLIQNNSHVKNEKFKQISAAAFDDDQKLEAELFGYVKGAFTGAGKDKEGLFHLVDGGGILFIDELHAMSKRVQEKLMFSISTNEKGEFTFMRVGGNKNEYAKFTLIVASNKSIDELKYKYLLPDFYDRIVQYVISIPSLNDSKSDRPNDWKATWIHQKFYETMKCPIEDDFMNWLASIELPGNWRDLQRIAIWYKSFIEFSPQHKKLIGFESALEYVKDQYRIIIERKDFKTHEYEFEFSDELSPFTQAENYQKQLALWAKDIIGQGSFKRAADFFNEKGSYITEKTLYNWANPKNKV